MPKNAVAIVPVPRPGGEMTCKVYFTPSRDRGVVSYLATLTLPAATSVSDWVDAMNRAAREEVAAKRLEPGHTPLLRVVGSLPGGIPVSDPVKRF